MNDVAGSSTTWAVIVIVVIPVAIIAVAELDERLRQRDSPLRPAVQILRTWALPFFAIWTLLVPVLGVESDSFSVRVAGTGLLLSVAAASLRVVRLLVEYTKTRSAGHDRSPPPKLLLAIPRLLVLLVAGWVLIDSVWGIDLSAALTALGVTSLVVSFALQDTLSGLASGMLLLADEPFQPGDWVNTGEMEGLVIDVNWRTSEIRDRNGDLIVVPNSQLANAAIVNYSRPTKVHRVVVPVQVAYSNAPSDAKAMLFDAAIGTPGVLESPAPEVRVVQIDDPLMGYEVHLWIDDYTLSPQVQSDFGALVWYQSHRHGVPLPSPAYDIFHHDPAAEGDDGPTPDEIRESLTTSPLLAQLSDEEIQRLVESSRPARYAAGEVMVEADSADRDLLVLVTGKSRLVVLDDDHEVSIGEIREGEVVGLLDRGDDEHRVLVRAVSDCGVLRLDAAIAGEIASRNSELSAALERTAAMRRRRVERAIERGRAAAEAEDAITDDVTADDARTDPITEADS